MLSLTYASVMLVRENRQLQKQVHKLRKALKKNEKEGKDA